MVICTVTFNTLAGWPSVYALYSTAAPPTCPIVDAHNYCRTPHPPLLCLLLLLLVPHLSSTVYLLTIQILLNNLKYILVRPPTVEVLHCMVTGWVVAFDTSAYWPCPVHACLASEEASHCQSANHHRGITTMHPKENTLFHDSLGVFSQIIDRYGEVRPLATTTTTTTQRSLNGRRMFVMRLCKIAVDYLKVK